MVEMRLSNSHQVILADRGVPEIKQQINKIDNVE